MDLTVLSKDKTYKMTLDDNIIILSDESNTGKTFLANLIVESKIEINKKEIPLNNKLYLEDSATFFGYCVSFSDKGIINKIFYNKDIIIIDDIDFEEEESIFTDKIIRFVKALVSEFKETLFIINTRRIIIPNKPIYILDLENEDVLQPYLLKSDIKLVDFKNYDSLVVEDSFRDSLSNIKTEDMVLNCKNKQGSINKSKEVFKMWSTILNTKNIAAAHCNSNVLKVYYSLLKEGFNPCVSIDYAFDNINTLTLIKILNNENIPILNYYSFEMLNIINRNNYELLEILADKEVFEIYLKALNSILNENTEFNWEKYNDLTIEKKCKKLLNVIKTSLKGNYELLKTFSDVIDKNLKSIEDTDTTNHFN